MSRHNYIAQTIDLGKKSAQKSIALWNSALVNGSPVIVRECLVNLLLKSSWIDWAIDHAIQRMKSHKNDSIFIGHLIKLYDYLSINWIKIMHENHYLQCSSYFSFQLMKSYNFIDNFMVLNFLKLMEFLWHYMQLYQITCEMLIWKG